jgi:hypothetical protein
MNTTKENHMSAKFPMVSLDKVEVKLTVKTEKVVAVDKIARMSGLSRASVINGYIDDGLLRSKVKLDMDDYKRVDEIRAENAAKRAAIKAKKGAR